MMNERVRQVDRWTAYWGLVVSATLAVVVAALAFPRTVADGFLWRYFWGPVVADGHGAACAVRVDGETVIYETAASCPTGTGIVATPGYTTVSTVSYGIVLLVAIFGVYLVLERYDVGSSPSFFYALVPFMFLGGTVRVIEDAVVALPETTLAYVPTFPVTTALISPFIYFLVFLLAVGSLGLSLLLVGRGVIDRYEDAMVVLGSALLGIAILYLGYLALHLPQVTISAPMLVVTLVGATLVTVLVWWGLERFVPEVNEATGAMGAVIVWGHALDGFANVLSLDWAGPLGLAGTYQSKHVVNQLIIDVTALVQPAEVTATIGTAWPFLLLKIAVATAVVWLFDEQLFEETPRFAILMLVAILAVGLGPGTRDLLRATLGI